MAEGFFSLEITDINILSTTVNGGRFLFFRDHWVYSLANPELRPPQRGHVMLQWCRPTNG